MIPDRHSCLYFLHSHTSNVSIHPSFSVTVFSRVSITSPSKRLLNYLFLSLSGLHLCLYNNGESRQNVKKELEGKKSHCSRIEWLSVEMLNDIELIACLSCLQLSHGTLLHSECKSHVMLLDLSLQCHFCYLPSLPWRLYDIDLWGLERS